MRVRRIVEDYEAKLRPADRSGRGKGKVEWQRFADGKEELDARFRKLDVPTGASVTIRLAEAVVGYVTVVKGAGRLTLEGASGWSVSKPSVGQVAEVVYGDNVLLTGVFEDD